MSRRWLGVLMGGLLAMQAVAGETGDPRWELALGGYLLADFDSALSLEDSAAGAGIAISPTRTLGMAFENTVLRFDGLRRLGGPHSLIFSWYSIRSDGYKAIQEEFSWEDEDGNSIVVRSARDVSTTVPLPVVAFTLAYQVDPRWSWSLDNQWFAMRVGEYSGNYTDVTLRVEYQAWKRVGIGLGIGSNNLAIGRENADYRFTFRNRIAGGLIYLTTRF